MNNWKTLTPGERRLVLALIPTKPTAPERLLISKSMWA